MSQRSVLLFLKSNPDRFFSIDDIMSELKLSRSSVCVNLSKLKMQGLVSRSMMYWFSGGYSVFFYQYNKDKKEEF
jgi:predicted transcriptional regulator